MEALTPWHLAVLLLGFVVLFGYKKLPDASRAVGRSLRIFRSEMQSIDGDGGAHHAATTAAGLEAEAVAAEAHARELRERARASVGESGAESGRP